MLSKRIVACLDVREGVVVKGTRFKNHQIVGEILPLARRYRDEGADELVFYDISASSDGTRVSRKWIEAVAKILDIPFCVAGGIRTLEDAKEILGSGADKISINTPAIENPALITEMAMKFGSQCVVVGVDSMRSEGQGLSDVEAEAGYEICSHTGRESTLRKRNLKTLEWLREVQERGAGEVVLNCMDRDGTGAGYDIEQLSAARQCLSIPLVASGGAKTADDFERAFREAKVDAGLAAGVFHRGELKIMDLKKDLSARSVNVRF